MFLGSCYPGLEKPEPEIFAVALDITKTGPERAIVIDDRPLGLEYALRAGMRTIEFRSVEQPGAAPASHGVQVDEERP